jgi:hypothetical protein
VPAGIVGPPTPLRGPKHSSEALTRATRALPKHVKGAVRAAQTRRVQRAGSSALAAAARLLHPPGAAAVDARRESGLARPPSSESVAPEETISEASALLVDQTSSRVAGTRLPLWG